MKWRTMTVIAVAVLAGSGARAAATAGKLEFEATIEGQPKAFAPRHVAAVWIEDAKGAFVKTLRVDGKKQTKRLEAWRKASGDNMADAVTGATLTQWGAIAASWDGRDAKGQPAPDGVYVLRAETVWWNGAGPQIEGVRFEKGLKPVKPEVPDAGAFRKITVSWTPGGAP